MRLPESLGRVLSEDVLAPHPFPPFRAAVKDGYAVRSAAGAGPLAAGGRFGGFHLAALVTRRARIAGDFAVSECVTAGHDSAREYAEREARAATRCHA